MLAFLTKLVTGRAILSSLVLTAAAALATFGVHLPDGADVAVAKVVEHLVDLLGLFVAATPVMANAHHAAPPGDTLPKTPSSVTHITIDKLLFLVGVVVLCGGCSSFLHFKDASLEDAIATFCDEKAAAHRAELEAEAKRTGLSPMDVLLFFKAACVFRVQRGEDGEAAGLAALRAKASPPAPGGGS
jgi:hypothetical protein